MGRTWWRSTTRSCPPSSTRTRRWRPARPIIREDIADKDEVGHGKRTHPNHIFTWEAGDKDGTDAVFASAAVTVREEILNPRVHPCPLETCGCVASFDKVTGQLTVYITSQAPHLVRTVVAMLSGIPESKIRIIGGDIGGGFGNKVPIYPGYVIAIVASIVTGVPIKWIESRIDNISTTGFARDYHGVGELAADKDGRIKALRFTALADHGAFNSHVSATKLPAGLFSICTGSYDIPKAYCRVDAVYTNKTNDAYYRLVSLGDENPAHAANRRPYRRLSADPLRDPRGHRRGNQGIEMEALAWAAGTRDLRARKDYRGYGQAGAPGDLSAARLNSLGQQLLTYIRSNRTALVDYGARYRAGRRISTSLAESAVNSLVAKRMVKSQQMRWSPSGAHLMLQVRAAMVNGNLRQRLRHKPDLPTLPLHPIFQPTPPLLRAA